MEAPRTPPVAVAAGAPYGSLLEREHDLAILEAALAGADGGRSALIAIEGPAGIGKTRLLAEGTRLLREAGVEVLLARASALETELPFGVVRQLFEHHGAVEHPALEQATAAAGEVLGGPAHGQGAADVSFAILHALQRITVALAAAGPVAFAVDDLHWCDEPSLRFLNYLARRLEGLGVTLLCTLRPLEHRARDPLVTELVGDQLATAIRPRPLSDKGTARLIGEELQTDADDAFSTACHTATGGNPHLLRELIRTMQAEGVTPDARHVSVVSTIGPRAVSGAVLVRLAHLSEDALKLARAAAVVQGGADLTFLAELAGLPWDDAAAAARALVAAEILGNDGNVAFVHPLIGAAIYEDIPAHERAFAHERAARHLHDYGRPPETVAVHLALAPMRGEAWVSEVLEAAARASLRAGSPATAVRYLARALEEGPPPEHRATLLLELGGAEAMLGAPSAIEHLTEAFEERGAPLVRRAAATILARTLMLYDRPDECIALIRRATADLEPGSEERMALDALELMAPVFGLGRPPAPESLPRRRAAGAGAGAKMLAAVVSRQWAYSGGNADECSRLALDALAGGDLLAADNAFLSVTAILTLVRADRPEAEQHWEDLRQESLVRGSLASKAATSLWTGFAALRRGVLDEAEASLRIAMEEYRLLAPSGVPHMHHAAFLSAVLRERGDLRGARLALEAVGPPRDRSDAARYWLDAFAELLLAEERFDEAYVAATDMEDRFAFLANPIDTPARSHRAVALYRLGRHGEGLALARESLGLARRWGAAGGVARALRVLGTLERDDGLAHLREAVEVAENSTARLEHAKALVALGASLRRARQTSAARNTLRQGIELATGIGATPLVAEARHELRAAGARLRSAALSGPDALTPAERRVTERAAAGQTNRAIAEALFVTTKTVELHLRNAYRKLGVSSRGELPEKLGAAA